MKKKYVVQNTFGVGEINRELKKGQEVFYDADKGILSLDGKEYETRNLKAAIKIEWLVPADGKFPELDGPIGETQEEAIDRRRKERFVKHEENKKNMDVIEADSREVGKIVVGMIDEEKDPEGFLNELGIEPAASAKPEDKKGKFKVIEDDTKEVVISTFEDKEISDIKKALNQGKKEKIDPVNFKVFNDHYDAESIHVGKYSNTSRENTIKSWTKLHWTKKADVINQADDKIFLNQLQSVETSKKIKDRITKRIEVL